MFDAAESNASFPKMEEDVLKFWEGISALEKSLEKRKGGKPFVIDSGAKVLLKDEEITLQPGQ